MFEVKIRKRVLKGIEEMPVPIQKILANLLDDLCARGPIRKDWHSFSKLGENTYHCHLARKWVACWQYEKKSNLIEVYYAGSRENAPY
jgi:mRNA-degrading endonuclease RelE of RelBE toxin-antitoxin system